MIAPTTAPITCTCPANSSKCAWLPGAAWNRIAEIDAGAFASVSGLHGTAQFDDDLTRGRYAQRFDIAVMGRSEEIYDGTQVWAKISRAASIRTTLRFPASARSRVHISRAARI